MSTDHREHLRQIKSFPSLVKYLRDELDWPIDAEDFDDLTFDYEPEELGLDSKTAAKIDSIKQLRPLTTDQPWGIFFVKFEPKRLPVVALRRILGQLVFKKRASANKSERPSWNLHDLLFISAYGEGDDRQISLAHFSEDAQMGNLATLKVLGWDGEDTGLHLDHVHHELCTKLRWPDDPDSADAWRQTWSSAFTLRHREVITTSQDLAISLADLARKIRRKVNAALKVESPSGKLRKLMKAFPESLIHDLDGDDFADMYAQTIAYGLLSARVSRQSGAIVADDVALMVPVTNPFLRELMETFLNLGGRKRKANGQALDFDELGIAEVVEMLRAANMEAVLRDFDNRNPQEDPVIHFYELFLSEYDAQKRMQRGVFYTPKPVVSFIVRSVDEILRNEFGLADGLADTTTWGEMVEKFPPLSAREGQGEGGFQIPEGVSPDQPFVQILDPAVGTGTFLVEVIDIVHRTMTAKWRDAGRTDGQIVDLWNDYVPTHLLPRLYGFELLMAPYAIAHMKIGLKLAETGYLFASDQRARMYLTNTLEPWQKQLPLIGFDALAHEAAAVNQVKRYKRFTVVVGNPPYSNMSANLADTARAVIEKYKFIGGERVVERNALQLERNLNDDYVKFIAWSEERLRDTGVGILSMISNNVYTWSPSLRGMRAYLLKTFPCIRILDLHGASQRGPADSRFADDENVFDIEQPVAISAFCSPPGKHDSCVTYTERVGTRSDKYSFLLQQSWLRLTVTSVTPVSPARRFVPSASAFEEEYGTFLPLTSICPLFAEGIKTGRDWLVIDFDEDPLIERMSGIRDSREGDDALCERIGLSRKKAWNFARARAALKGAHLCKCITKLVYRPFDERRVFFHPDWIASPSIPVMRNLVSRESTDRKKPRQNLAILAGRISRDHTSYLYWCSRQLSDKCILSSLDNVSVFPALVFPTGGEGSLNLGETVPEVNLSKDFLTTLNQRLGLTRPSESIEALTKWTFDIFHYIYALLWAPSYRKRFAGDLMADFPRLPVTGNIDLFKGLSRLGAELVAHHLLEFPKPNKPLAAYNGRANPEVGRIAWASDTIWLDAPAAKKGQRACRGTMGFGGVPEAIWDFHIGGYQVCEKWLKDRKGRRLSADDIGHYQRIIVDLHETIAIVARIDDLIEKYGGWPGAFAMGGNLGR